MRADGDRQGPLRGLRIVEMAGIGPGPYAAMLLAELGADVLRIDRPVSGGLGIAQPSQTDLLARSRRSVAVDLKSPDGVALVADLAASADGLIEGFRPGTMERLGLGPTELRARNPRLAYGRVTGWGQDGPLARAAGHDLNYLALTGALHAIGRAGGPATPPLNLVADFAGGSLFLVIGMVSALLHAARTGEGQVVDAAMVDGAASLMTMFFGLAAAGLHSETRGANLLDSGAPHYDVYACADGLEVSVAPIEGKFRAVFLHAIGFDPTTFPDCEDAANWAAARGLIAERLASRSRPEWCALLEGTDSCFAPVLSMREAVEHPHNRARGTFVTVEGINQPAPAPRFSATPLAAPTAPGVPGADTRSALADWGISPDRIETLLAANTISQRQ